MKEECKSNGKNHFDASTTASTLLSLATANANEMQCSTVPFSGFRQATLSAPTLKTRDRAILAHKAQTLKATTKPSNATVFHLDLVFVNGGAII